jgi:hypothetical protein
VRTRATWLIVLPLTLAGVEAAHALANAAFGSPADAAELFEGARSGAGPLPLAGAVALACVLVGLVRRVADGSCARAAALPFALLPPAAFLALESVESLLHSGTLPAPGATLVCGLALQLPFAVAGYLLARALLRLGDGVRRVLAGLRRAPLPVEPAAPARELLEPRPRSSRRPHACSGRAPPVSPVRA